MPRLLSRPAFEMRFVFIEMDRVTHAALGENLHQFLGEVTLPPQLRVDYPILGEFTEQMSDVLTMLERQHAPAFVFIDPFGPLGFPLDVIQHILSNPHCEVFVRFNYTRLANTFLKRGDVEAQIDLLYGCSGWR